MLPNTHFYGHENVPSDLIFGQDPPKRFYFTWYEDKIFPPILLKIGKCHETGHFCRCWANIGKSGWAGESCQAALGIACAFAARVGPSSVAAHQVASQLYILLAFASDSLAVAVQCLVADRLGAGLISDAREVAGRVLLFSLAWGVGLLILFQVFGDVLPLIFTSNREVLTAIAPVIAVVGLLQPLNAFVFVGDGILQGTQDFVYEALTMAVSASLLPGYVWLHGYLGGGETTLLDVWVGLVMMQCCRSLTFTFRHFLDPKGPLAAP